MPRKLQRPLIVRPLAAVRPTSGCDQAAPIVSVLSLSPPSVFLLPPSGGPTEIGTVAWTCPGPDYAPSGMCIFHTPSDASCNGTMVLSPVWPCRAALPVCLGPDGGADGHNETELTNSVCKDGAERASRS